MPLFLLALTTALLAMAAVQSLNSTTDLNALYSLRGSLGLRARDWPRKADPCSSWTGVGCDADGRVTSLNLYGLRRTRLGRLNPRFAVDGIQNLTRLSSFNATGFPLPGPIPPWLGLHPRLAVLDLRRSSISGEIPSSLAGSKLVVLILADNNLTRSIPPQLGSLTSLISLDLSSNLLVGPLPDTLKNLKDLQNLNIGGNFFTGSLHDSLFSNLSKLESVTLSHNKFSGSIPASLCSLPRLRFLDLSYNNLTGNLPDLSLANSTPNSISLDLSHNLLYGSIPSGFSPLISRFSSVDISYNHLEGSVPFKVNDRNLSIVANCFLNASNQRALVDCEEFYKERGIAYDGTLSSSPPSSHSSKKMKKAWKYIVIAVVCGSTLLIFSVVLVVLCIMRCGTNSAQGKKMDKDAASIAALQHSIKVPTTGEEFTYEQLAISTSNFGEDSLIKHGHSGDLYHGVLEDGRQVVVKRIETSSVKNEAYLVELDLFGRFLHERFVTILGQCLQNENEKFIVYKQMPHRDLSYALHRNPTVEEDGLQSLDWITRLKIAIGVAEALCFLHNECMPPLVHRDIQASSILLDDKFEVRLGSLSSVCRAQEKDGHHNLISRFLRFSETSDQSASGVPPASCAYDVYCFGKVLLELVTGELGISGADGGPAAAEWLEHALSHIDINEKSLVTKIVDPSLVVDEDLLEEVWAMSIVARSCLNPRPSKRPPAKHIRRALENPLKVVREDSSSGSVRLRDSSSLNTWTAAFFGSWGHSSQEIASGSAAMRNGRSLRQSGTPRSQGSAGEMSSRRRHSKEIFPEPQEIED